MSLDEIMDKSFDKLYEHLNNFFDENKLNNSYALDPEYLLLQKKIMRTKYNNFKDIADEDNLEKRKNIISHIANIFDKIKQ